MKTTRRAAMKRSSNLRLVLMTAAVPVALAGCESEPTGAVVQSIEQCQATSQLSAAECRTAYDTALAKHASNAPRFPNQAACDTEFGDCEPVQEQGQTSYIPPMGGFLIGYALGNMGRGYGGAAPLYRSRQGGDYYNTQGGYVGNRPGNVTGARGALPPPARAITVSRSGFGSSAAARSAFRGS